MDRRDFLVAKIWVYFGYNFPNIKEVINYICEKTNEGESMRNHLLAKWDMYYDLVGCHAVMNKFFAELSAQYQEALVDYAIKVYAPTAFHWSEEDKALLNFK